MADSFEVVLEKKSRGKGFLLSGRAWAYRRFKVYGQTMEYYDKNSLKESFSINGLKSEPLSSADADNRPFPLLLTFANGDKLVLSAKTEHDRSNCIEVFNLAANDPNWVLSESSFSAIESTADDAAALVDDANSNSVSPLLCNDSGNISPDLQVTDGSNNFSESVHLTLGNNNSAVDDIKGEENDHKSADLQPVQVNYQSAC